MTDTQSFTGLLDQLAHQVTDAAVATGLAQCGVRMVASSVSQNPVYPENPDPQVFIGSGPPTAATGVLGWWRRSHLVKQAAVDGPVDQYLVQALIVYLFSLWEGEYRPALQNLIGSDIRSDAFGDLRHLRNDIVHHRGIASRSNAGRCVDCRWRFTAGQQIALNGPDLAGLIDSIHTAIGQLKQRSQEQPPGTNDSDSDSTQEPEGRSTRSNGFNAF